MKRKSAMELLHNVLRLLRDEDYAIYRYRLFVVAEGLTTEYRRMTRKEVLRQIILAVGRKPEEKENRK